MYKVNTNLESNLIIVRSEGQLSDEEVSNMLEELKAGFKQLQKGFTLINDISKALPVSLISAERVKRLQKNFIKRKSGQIIRVVNEPTTKQQFNDHAAEVGYQAIEVSSMDEAMEIVELSMLV